jgi:hypothetical protein
MGCRFGSNASDGSNFFNGESVRAWRKYEFTVGNNTGPGWELQQQAHASDVPAVATDSGKKIVQGTQHTDELSPNQRQWQPVALCAYRLRIIFLARTSWQKTILPSKRVAATKCYPCTTC